MPMNSQYVAMAVYTLYSIYPPPGPGCVSIKEKGKAIEYI